MEDADKLFERAKRLKPEELSKLVVRLEEYLASFEESQAKPPLYLALLPCLGQPIQIGLTSRPIKGSTLPKCTPRSEDETGIRRHERFLCALGRRG
jgi:hypothetical protein